MSKHQSADPQAELAPTLRIAGTPRAEIRDRDRDRDPKGEELGFRSIHLGARKSWNVQGLNDPRKRSAVRAVVSSLCNTESKVSFVSGSFLSSFGGPYLNKYVFIDAVGASGGIITGWSSRFFSCLEVIVRTYSITTLLHSNSCGAKFYLTNVYGPASWDGKEEFFAELSHLKELCVGKWIICDDFNCTRSQEERRESAGVVEGGVTRQPREIGDFIVHRKVETLPREDQRMVPLGGPSFPDGLPGLFLPHLRPPPHLRPSLRLPHHHLQAPPQLLPLEQALAIDLPPHPHPPLLRHQPRVRPLIRPLGHAHRGHPRRHALHRRVPSAVRHEAPNRGVVQNPNLGAPLHHHPLLIRLLLLDRLRLLVVLPHYPQVRPPALLQALAYLLHLPLLHHGHAPEGHVHHRPLRLPIEPLHVALLVGREEVVDGFERAGLQRVEGVHQNGRLNPRGVGSVLAALDCVERFPELVEEGRVGIVLGRGGEEGGEVSDSEGREPRQGHGVRGGAGVGGGCEGGDGAAVAVEVVVVDGERGGGLDPAEHRGDAVGPRHVGDPRQQDCVQDAGHALVARREAVEHRGEGPRPHLLDTQRRAVGGGIFVVVAFDAVVVGNVGEEAVGELLIVGGEGGEHAAVCGDAGGEGDAGAGGAGEASRQVARRVDVALGRLQNAAAADEAAPFL
ncbi:hypothetical protein ACMD2_13450 [Ananas comosus]|uniref:Endonuclease/exonuclease/phosphatase domain-containing protein n=1 Tax=Ananas comosus TaxID=4615 RepID=A0A199VL70_ANACO|nr:hypothetical protein ACMD2_13450 [Ananas comosus]